MSLIFTDYGALKCPSCKSEFLHQITTEVFERDEDAIQGLHVTVTRQSVITDANIQGSPSGRRQGLTIEFKCEACEHKPSLSIYQHKGSTFFDFK